MRMNYSGWAMGAALFLAISAQDAAAQADTTSDTTDYEVSNFNSRMLDTPWWGFWYTFTDRLTKTADTSIMGNSYFSNLDSTGSPIYDSLGWPDSTIFPRGRSGDSLDYALRYSWVLGDRPLSCGDSCTYAPYLGFGMGFTSQGAGILNLRGSAHITFWAKSDSADLVFSVAVTDSNTATEDYSRRFTVDNTWKKYDIPLVASALFAQPPYANPKTPFDPTILKGLNFGINKTENPERHINGLTLDDIFIEDWKFVDPMYVPPVDDPIRVAPRAQSGSGRLTIQRSGDLLRLRLPSAYADKQGTVEAMDATGRVLGKVDFGRQAGELVMRLPGSALANSRIFYQIKAREKLR